MTTMPAIQPCGCLALPVRRDAHDTITFGVAFCSLHAAAPDLLEATKALVQALREIRDSGPGLVYYHGDALDMGLQAIAKATGSTP